ncbi:MAG: protein Tex, partial [Trebonia sp.]|nr:protein Tex [Trebonia sp.]
AIVAQRDATGAFATREQLKGVPRLGPKAFEQCAGFLRIRGGDDPLDTSGVHPEAYPVIRRILEKTRSDVATLIGNAKTLRGLNPAEFTDEAFGLPTVSDILKELEKPGRDPRPEFQTATFAEGVQTLGDLEPGMVLEGVDTNVAAFGAFVDIGVHQDGLVHVSAMSNTFVADPRDVAKSGDVVKVRVQSVDIPRNRISLTMRLQDDGAPGASGGRPPPGERPGASRTSGADSGRPRSAPGPGGGGRGGGSGGSGNDRRGGGPGAGGDRRGNSAGTGGDRGGAGSGNSNDRRGGGTQGGAKRDPRNSPAAPAAPANGSMADALRRAGLVNDKGAQPGKQDRRSNRP